ncbi:MAG: hypothetical protein PHU27_12835 [Salinivirgaceae bacterium]|nr:hypothetical protein [Salinivirgaceae bacterium]
MKKMKTALLGLALLCLFGSANAQKKYAVLITGDYAAKNLPAGATLYGNGLLSEEKIANSFWNDTYLTWKMLKEKGFAPEDIYVLFANGIDFPQTEQGEGIVDRYKPPLEQLLPIIQLTLQVLPTYSMVYAMERMECQNVQKKIFCLFGHLIMVLFMATMFRSVSWMAK